ncbi:MAG: glycoside hydrolase family 127 protein, partial [Salinivirgaceae bacterium]|nr:glycoside hydrolase family 127 protein [Salinivirgaceae bacterium]
KVRSEVSKGYITISRNWKKGDQVTVDLPMEIKAVVADEKVEADRSKIAYECGPLVYCAEWPDNNQGNVLSLLFDKEGETSAEFADTLLNGVKIIRTHAQEVSRNVDKTFHFSNPVDITLIPYYSWNNRGPGEMMVWLATDTTSVYPQPAPTIANKSKVTASRMVPSLKVALTDQYEPANSNDHARPYYHWWPINNTWEWVQYDFDTLRTVSSSRVYWFDDGPFGGCRIPVAWELQYLENGKWKPVKAQGTYKITKDAWDEISFDPITTQALKLRVKLSEKFSTGIHEWEVK